MHKIIEGKNKYGTYYARSYSISNENTSSEDIEIIQARRFHTVHNNRNIIMLYDSNMNPIDEAISFINFNGMKNDSRNYRLQASSALLLLYDFLALYNISFEDMTADYAGYFLLFIKGISSDGIIFSTSLKTYRSSETINSYFKVYRKYAKFLNLQDSHILLTKKKIYYPNDMGGYKTYKYEYSSKTITPEEIPPYISLDEYKRILDVTHKHNLLRDRILIRLMYENGLRIGECLGLTLEDFSYKTDENNRTRYYICLRNRLSDSRFGTQNAKGCMKVFHAADYNSPSYRRENIGCRTIQINRSLASEFIHFINITHNDKAHEKLKNATADSVTTNKKNYYMFINKRNSYLEQNAWNSNLKETFIKAGVSIDKIKKKNGLNHRLRHGCAVFLEKYCNLDPYSIQLIMRHKSAASTAIYLTPSESDIADLQERLVSQWDAFISNNYQ